MTPTALQEATAAITKQDADERRNLTKQLTQAERLEKEVAKEQLKASDRYWKLARRNFDEDPDEKEKAAERAHDAAIGRWDSVNRTVVSLRKKLAQLDDTVAFERRVKDKADTITRIAQLKTHNGKEAKVAASATTRKRTTNEDIPSTVGDRIAKSLESGTSTGDVAAALKKDKVKPVFYGEWTNKSVRRTYKVYTGETNIPAKAKQAGRPIAVKDRAPAATTKLSRNGNGVQPFAKSTQAAGTSRGGTGSRKKAGTGRKVAGRKKVTARKR